MTDRVEKIMGRGNGGTVLVHVGMTNAGKEGTTSIVEKCMNILKNMKQAMSSYQEFYHSVWKPDTRRQKFETDGTERDGGVPLPGRGSRIRGFVGQLFRERGMRDDLHLGGKRAAVFAEGLSGAVASGVGKVR